ncbi:MAG: alpha/beta hydrolase family protein [Phycisphaerales bacterium]
MHRRARLLLLAMCLPLLTSTALAWACEQAPPSPAPAPAQAASEAWGGTISAPTGPLHFSVVFDRGASPVAAKLSIPDQGLSDHALREVSRDGTLMNFTLAMPGWPKNAFAVFKATAAADGQTATGVMHQMGMDMPVEMKRLKEGEVAGPRRPQHPKPPYPYTQREVLVLSADGAKITGTLTVPEEAKFGKGPHPAAVMITGSGTQDRDESLMGHKPFLVIADHLTRAGLAVLRVDDRGWNNNFDPTRGQGTTDDFALDAAACVEFLSTQPEVDAKRVGLIGHSEGGLIAPMVAAKDTRVAFLVLLAGTGVRGDVIARRQIVSLPAAAGAPANNPQTEAQADRLIAALERDADSDELLAILRDLGKAQMGGMEPTGEVAKQLEQNIHASLGRLQTPWFKRFLRIDPAEHLAKVKAPVLAVNGGLDMQVEAKENLAGIAAALKAGGNTDYETHELAGLNHLFQTAKTGAMSEYAQIEETFSPAALEMMTAWVRKRAGLEK